MALKAFRMRGTEHATWEVAGRLDSSALELPRALGADGAVSLLLFHTRDMAANWTGWPRYTYNEALWRVSVTWREASAWFAMCCDIDHALVRSTSRHMVRYPLRAAKLSVNNDGANVICSAGTFELTVSAGASTDAQAPALRPMLVQQGDHLYEIPWEESPPHSCIDLPITVKDELGPNTFGTEVTWESTALQLKGRGHSCGFAQRVH